MPQFNALYAVGMVFADVGEETPRFLGSCFALRTSRAVLTAAHCINDVALDSLYVRMPTVIVVSDPMKPGLAVSEAISHPTADLGLLRLPPEKREWTVEPFWNAVPSHGLGEDLFAYGYPEDVRSDAQQPTARMFRGYVQRRIWGHRSFMGYEYDALELDFACPLGLSGGPLFRPDAPQMVIGVATENFESTTSVDAFEEETGPGETKRIEYRRVLSYGLAVALESVNDWLDDHLPAFDSAAYAQRVAGRPAG